MWEFTITILLKRFLNETAESVSESIAPNPLNYADFIATVFPISFEREKEPVTIAAEIRDEDIVRSSIRSIPDNDKKNRCKCM